MNTITIFLIALGLSMDSFAVSTAKGLPVKKSRMLNAFKLSIFLAIFQSFMTLIGWLTGSNIRQFISDVDHWVAFGLLTLIGCKMIYESTKENLNIEAKNMLSIQILLTLSIATSIDALAVGITFGFFKLPIINPLIIIGIVTFLLSNLGFFLGNRFGHILRNWSEIIGGLILIIIGVKILLEHLLI
ncbi:manganese efflux pump MntP [[Eubacterium] cellulosolvens]